MNVKQFSLMKDIIMFICLIMLMATPFGTTGVVFGWHWHLSTWHMFFGIILTIFFLIHIGLNFKWLTGVCKNWKKGNTATKVKFWMMILVCLFMGASITTGIIWALGLGAYPIMDPVLAPADFGAFMSTIRIWHAVTSWAAFLLTGVHIGLHLTKFLSFLAKPKKPAPKPEPAAAE